MASISTNTTTSSHDSSDPGSSRSSRKHSHRRRRRSKYKAPFLPPLGIFWDIENCQIPKNKSASAVVQRLRDFFLDNYREAEFLVVCDVKKERAQIVQELHDSQVNLIHVASTSKNAADEKLRQSLRRFAEVHEAPSCVVLISGDINFASDLSDLRFRKKIRVVLVHNSNVADALILCASEHFCYSAITDGLPREKGSFGLPESAFLLVSNLPRGVSAYILKNRINFLTNNCGGRVVEVVTEEGVAFVRFSNRDVANRAQKRVQGEDVFGNKITATVATPSLRTYTGRKVKGDSNKKDSSFQSNSSYSRDSNSKKKFYQQNNEGQGFASAHASGGHFRRPTSRPHKTSVSSDASEDGYQPVDLIISNLDSSLGVKEIRKMLTNMLKEYAMILSLNVSIQGDGSPVAVVKVNGRQAAQCVVSMLHRQKMLGQKKIVITTPQSSPDPDQLRAMVISILQEVPDSSLPLFKFIELLESRYHCTVSVSELSKLKDVCKVTADHLGTRTIAFIAEVKTAASRDISKTLSLPYCPVHCPDGPPLLGWCEPLLLSPLNVCAPLKDFARRTHGLLDLHQGRVLPLATFHLCYEQTFARALVADSSDPSDPTPADPARAVPLEHLVSCVPGVRIARRANVKMVAVATEQESADDREEAVLGRMPPSLVPGVTLLCREVVDLLRTADRCQLPMSKFIPAYHHHFGRQCHVADYGYTKLVDLFEAIPHVVQIMGDGSQRVVTLTHQAQMRRFTSDLLRVLKAQPMKQTTVERFAAAYEKVRAKKFAPSDYGLCSFDDLLAEVEEHVVVLLPSPAAADDVLISVPKREQTVKEVVKTKQFAMEAMDILRHSSCCTMLFNKFVPAYHHHFGYQCRVADYGFGKLIELFEAIPDVVEIRELQGGERAVCLNRARALGVLGGQLVGLVENYTTLSVDKLPHLYLREYGYPLRPQVYDCGDVRQLVDLLDDYVRVRTIAECHYLEVAPSVTATANRIRVWSLLCRPPHRRSLTALRRDYKSRYGHPLVDVPRDVVVAAPPFADGAAGDNVVTLTPEYALAAQLYHTVYNGGGSTLFPVLARNLNLGEDHGIWTVDELIRRFGFLFFDCDYQRTVLVLNRTLIEHQVALPAQMGGSGLAGGRGSSAGAPANNGGAVVKKVGSSQTPQVAPSAKSSVTTPIKRVSPPKPDTPCTPTGEYEEGSSWHLSRMTTPDLNLCLKLPICENPRLMGNPFDLISPARHLSYNLWGEAPEPRHLPMPPRRLMPALAERHEESRGAAAKKVDDERMTCGDDEYDDQDSGVANGSRFHLFDESEGGDASHVTDVYVGVGAKRRTNSFLNFDRLN